MLLLIPMHWNYLINHKKDNLYRVKGKLMDFNSGFVYNGIEMLCNQNLEVLPVGPRCSGWDSSYTPAIVINPSWVLRGTGLAKSQVIGSLFRTCMKLIVNIIRWSFHQFPITNLDLLIYECMCIESYAKTHT